jgi:predicted dehydrogenase
MKKVKWGFIGAGDVTNVKSGPAFNKVDNSEIIYVMRRDLAKAAEYAKKHGFPNYTSNADELIGNSEVDAVYIATPPYAHAHYCIEAAKAGKHVYVEKPMAMNFAECQAMIKACEDNGVKLFVAYYRREMEYFKKVRELINNDAVGNVKLVNINFLAYPKKDDYKKDLLPWRVKPEISGGGYFFDLASHQLDFLDLLFGPISSATGNSANQLNLYEPEDIVTSSFEFESGILGSGIWCFTIENGEEVDRTEIIGDKGNLSFSFFNPNPITLEASGKSENFKIEYPEHVQQSLIESVVNDILGKDQCISTGSSASRTNKIMDEILK